MMIKRIPQLIALATSKDFDTYTPKETNTNNTKQTYPQLMGS